MTIDELNAVKEWSDLLQRIHQVQEFIEDTKCVRVTLSCQDDKARGCLVELSAFKDDVIEWLVNLEEMVGAELREAGIDV